METDDELFDAKFLGRLRTLFFKLRKRRQLQKHGNHPTPAAGFTREFKDHRRYTPGDDFRAIDWRLFARLEKPFIRIFEEVQEFHVHILLDRSRSMLAPHAEKRVTALRTTVALAYLALVSQHRVSIHSLGEGLRRETQPLKGQGHIHVLLSQLPGLDFAGKTDLVGSLRQFRPSRDRRGLVFIVSDLLGQAPEMAGEALLQATRWPAETHVIHVLHPQEMRPDFEGEIRLINVGDQPVAADLDDPPRAGPLRRGLHGVPRRAADLLHAAADRLFSLDHGPAFRRRLPGALGPRLRTGGERIIRRADFSPPIGGGPKSALQQVWEVRVLMRFLEPSLFYAWSALVLVPLVLYLFRPRPRTVPTSTLPFFQRLARHYQDSTWLRRLKRLISLFLSILVIVAAAAALARLVAAPAAGSLKTVVLLVNRSASMASKAEGGPTRLEAAVALARRRLSALPAGVGVIVVTYDCRPEVVLSRSVEPRQVERALDSIHTRPVGGDSTPALVLARRLAALERPAAIWHFTDRPPLPPLYPLQEGRATPQDSPLPPGKEGVRASVSPLPPGEGQGVRAGRNAADVETVPESPLSPALSRRERGTDDLSQQQGRTGDIHIDHVNVALPDPINVGITAFELRRLPMEAGHFEAFLQIHSAASRPTPTELEMRLDDKLVAIRKLVVPPRGKETLLVPLEADPQADRVLNLKVSAAGDVLAADNVISARVPKVRALRVLWISPQPNPFTELALSSLSTAGELEVLQGGPSAWPPTAMPDVVLFDGWLPNAWPECPAVIVVTPPGSLGPVRAVKLSGPGLAVDAVRAVDRGHPLLYGVATGRVALMQTAVLEASGPLESVWLGPQGPLLAAGESHGQRVVVMGFSPQKSEQLPLLASYPLLFGNAIYWTAQNQLETARGMNRRTGELVSLQGKTLTWHAADDPAAAASIEQSSGNSVELDRIGLWETEAGEAGSAALLSPSETLLAAADPAAPQDEATVAASVWQGDLAPLLMWAVLAILVLESWLFHKLWAY